MSLLTTLNRSDSLASLIYRPSLEVYLDAIESPFTLDGSNHIERWDDLSGKENHAQQVGTDAMPVYVADKDGYPAIYSNGDTGRKLDFTHSITNNDPFTVIGVFLADDSVTDPSTGSSLNVIFAFGGADGNDDSIALRQLRTDLQNLSFVGYGGGSTLDDSPFTDFESYSISYDGADVTMHYGETQESGSGYAAGSTRVFGDGRLFNESPENTARTGIGWLRSLLLFKEALSDADRNLITNGLKVRYGIL